MLNASASSSGTCWHQPHQTKSTGPSSWCQVGATCHWAAVRPREELISLLWDPPTTHGCFTCTSAHRLHTTMVSSVDRDFVKGLCERISTNLLPHQAPAFFFLTSSARRRRLQKCRFASTSTTDWTVTSCRRSRKHDSNPPVGGLNPQP